MLGSSLLADVIGTTDTVRDDWTRLLEGERDATGVDAELLSVAAPAALGRRVAVTTTGVSVAVSLAAACA